MLLVGVCVEFPNCLGAFEDVVSIAALRIEILCELLQPRGGMLLFEIGIR